MRFFNVRIYVCHVKTRISELINRNPEFLYSFNEIETKNNLYIKESVK